MNKQYYYVDVHILTKSVVGWGITPSATLTGDTTDANVHRVFLTKGQYGKLLRKLEHTQPSATM